VTWWEGEKNPWDNGGSRMFFLDKRYSKWDTMEEILLVNGGACGTATAAPPVQPSRWLNW